MNKKDYLDQQDRAERLDQASDEWDDCDLVDDTADKLLDTLLLNTKNDTDGTIIFTDRGKMLGFVKHELSRKDREDKELFFACWEKWGDDQYVVAIEELSELTKTLTKHLRGKTDSHAILEEMADVDIMLDQLKQKYGYDAFQAARKEKIERLKRLVNE